MNNPLIRSLLMNKSLNIEQKMTYFMMFAKPEELPDNPNKETFLELGKKIKSLVDSGEITLTGFDENGVLQYKQQWTKFP
jgi:hypothetical protein